MNKKCWKLDCAPEMYHYKPKKRNFSLNDNICVFSYKGQQLLNLIKSFSKISWICCKIYSLKLISQKMVYDAHGFWINWKKLFFEFEKRGDKRVIFKSMTWIWQFRFFGDTTYFDYSKNVYLYTVKIFAE